MQKLPKLVVGRLLPQQIDSHPDANLLTAFAEQALSDGEREDVMAHLARCSDCREVVALALPQIESLEVKGHAGAAHRGWFSWPVLRWGVVAAGIITVASVGVLELHSRHHGETTLFATNVTHEQLTVAPKAAPSAPESSVQQTAISAETEVSQPAPVSGKKHSIAQPTVTPGSPATAGAIFPKSSSPARAGSAGAGIAGIGSGAEVAPGRAYMGGSGGGRDPLTMTTSGQSALGSSEPSGDQVEAPVVGKAKAAPEGTDSFSPAPSPPMHTDPSLMKGARAPRWTISPAGTLQRSLDGGQSWQDVDVAANTPARADAGANLQIAAEAAPVETKQTTKAQAAPMAKSKASYSPSAGVNSPAAPAPASSSMIFRAVLASSIGEVWAGGSGAGLYHSVDGGNRWTRIVPYAAGVSPTGDIVSIRFSDSQNGTVTTSSAEVWATSDDGQTWRRQQ